MDTASDEILAIFLRGYSCAIGPIRTADPQEMERAITAANIVLHASVEDAMLMWMLIVEEAMQFLVENAEHIASHHSEEGQDECLP